MAPLSQGPVAPRLPAELLAAAPAVLDADVHWEGLVIEADFSGQVAEDPVISGCRLTGAVFVGTELVRARVNDTVFQRCDLSGASFVHGAFARVELVDCRLSGADLSGGQWRDVTFRECRLADANLRMTSGERACFDSCDLSRADLYGAHLAGACIFNSNLREAQISQATLKDARLHGSAFDGIKGAEALRGSTIGSAQVLPVAFQLLAAMGIKVDDEVGPGVSPA
jgi:uncharacterized protein YjbI with pentapeptide repeats